MIVEEKKCYSCEHSWNTIKKKCVDCKWNCDNRSSNSKEYPRLKDNYRYFIKSIGEIVKENSMFDPKDMIKID